MFTQTGNTHTSIQTVSEFGLHVVYHDILLKRMRLTYSISDTALNWFVSYLSGCVETASKLTHHYCSQSNMVYLEDQSWGRYYSSFIQAKCRTLYIHTICHHTALLTTVRCVFFGISLSNAKYHDLY